AGALDSSDASLLPLGGISNRLTVFCNEAGDYVKYRSDEHGFNNPPGIWSDGKAEIAAIGDSFVQGTCVPTDQPLVGVIRTEYPGTLNLGMSGNGPLLELATFEEYVTTVKPRIVLWFFFETNDLTDLAAER